MVIAISALTRVAEARALMGLSPSETRNDISLAFWPWGITGTSVARPMERPAASASLKDWSWRSRSLRPRSRSDSGTFGLSGTTWLM